MRINSSQNNRRILRYTSMSRRRHLGMRIAHDRRERFIKHQDNVDEIRAAEQRLTQTTTHSMSTMDFDRYVSIWGEVINSDVRRSSQTGESTGNRPAFPGFGSSSGYNSCNIDRIPDHHSYIVDRVNLNIDRAWFSYFSVSVKPSWRSEIT